MCVVQDTFNLVAFKPREPDKAERFPISIIEVQTCSLEDGI